MHVHVNCHTLDERAANDEKGLGELVFMNPCSDRDSGQYGLVLVLLALE